jgi:hypothetical protein
MSATINCKVNISRLNKTFSVQCSMFNRCISPSGSTVLVERNPLMLLGLLENLFRSVAGLLGRGIDPSALHRTAQHRMTITSI